MSASASADREALLDAIVMVVAADGEVTEREMQLAMVAARDLPGLAAAAGELDDALGAAFERFVDEGTQARTAAIVATAPDARARLEILLAAVLAAAVDGAPTPDEIECIRALGAAMGAEPREIDGVIAAAPRKRQTSR